MEKKFVSRDRHAVGSDLGRPLRTRGKQSGVFGKDVGLSALFYFYLFLGI